MAAAFSFSVMEDRLCGGLSPLSLPRKADWGTILIGKNDPPHSPIFIPLVKIILFINK